VDNADQGAHVGGHTGTPVRRRLFQRQERRTLRPCHPITVSGWTICTAERQPHHTSESHAQSMRSIGVRKAWAMRPVQDRDLVSERDDFQVQRRA
jgi:hypothetical protein